MRFAVNKIEYGSGFFLNRGLEFGIVFVIDYEVTYIFFLTA